MEYLNRECRKLRRLEKEMKMLGNMYDGIAEIKYASQQISRMIDAYQSATYARYKEAQIAYTRQDLIVNGRKEDQDEE